MTDIEKRAESSVAFTKFEEGMDEKDVFLHNILMQGRREGYIMGAKEQKVIDDDHLREATKMVIDKACEWLVKNNINYTTMDGDVIPAYNVVQGLRRATEE